MHLFDLLEKVEDVKNSVQHFLFSYPQLGI